MDEILEYKKSKDAIPKFKAYDILKNDKKKKKKKKK